MLDAQPPKPVEVMLQAGWEDPGSASPALVQDTHVHNDGVVGTDPGPSGRVSPFHGGPAITLSAAYRPWRWTAFGVEAAYRWSLADSVDGYDTLSRGALRVGGFAKLYFLEPGAFLEPWISAGVAYVRDTIEYSGPAGGGFESTDALRHDGLGIPLAAGVDRRLSRDLWIGLSARLEPTLAVGGSLSAVATSPGSPDEAFPSEPTATSSYVTWSVGLSTRVAFGK